MRKVIFALVLAAGALWAAISDLTLPNETISGGNPPQVIWVDQNFDSVKTRLNQIKDTVNALQAGTAAFSGLTASLPVFTNASKRPVSNAMTGTGSVAMSNGANLVSPNLSSPTLAGAVFSDAANFGNDIAFTADRTIRRSAATGFLVLSGGSSSANGANIILIGGSHATAAGDWQFRSGNTDRLVWDESATTLSLTGKFVGSDTVAAATGFRAGSAGATDVSLYRSGADTWTTPDAMVVGGALTADTLISAKLYTEDSFTGTLTAASGATATIRYVRIGKLVTAHIPAATGTSTGTTLTITGMPAAIRPARTQAGQIGACIDSGLNILCEASIATDGTITFSPVGPAAAPGFSRIGIDVWTNSGSKGILGFTMSYTLQ